MLTIIVSPAGRGNFVAHLDGRQLCNATRSPFLTAARQLLSEGVDPDTKIIMRHAGSDTDCLTSTIGKAAKLCVLEGQGPPRFARNRAMIDDEKDVPETCVNAPLHALNDDWGTSGSPDAEKSLCDAKTATRRVQRSRLTARPRTAPQRKGRSRDPVSQQASRLQKVS